MLKYLILLLMLSSNNFAQGLNPFSFYLAHPKVSKAAKSFYTNLPAYEKDQTLASEKDAIKKLADNFFNNIIPPAGNPATTDTVSVDLEQPETNLTVKNGTEFQVRFPEKAGGTGYSWNIAGAPVSCKLINTEMVTKKHKPGMTGVPQTTILTFTATKEGSENISFTFNRVWEKDVPPADTKILHLKVE